MIFTPAEAKMECDKNVRALGSMVSYKKKSKLLYKIEKKSGAPYDLPAK